MGGSSSRGTRGATISIAPGLLERGVAEFRRRWPTEDDLHASLYEELAELTASGLDRSSWEQLVDVLSDWRALRPCTKVQIVGAGQPRLPELERLRRALVSKARSPAKLDLGQLDSAHVFELFREAERIKPTKSGSPMFASKLCHFLAPGAYVVCDGVATSVVPSYDAYWNACADAWRTCDRRDELKRMLARETGRSPGDAYPWGAKIAELCCIGARAAANPT